MLKWWLALILVTLVALLYTRQRLILEPAQVFLPADGAQHRALTIRLPWFNFDPVAVGELGRIQGQEVFVLSPVNPGHARIDLLWRSRTLAIPVTFVFDPGDSYGDGTPDFLRLHTARDRDAFRTWFTLIAQSQVGRTKPEINDCAALLRYAYRQALHGHDAPWLIAQGIESPAPSIRQYRYPQTPLGANLFRITLGRFVPADLNNGSFAQFADAQTLMRNNSHLVGRDLRSARNGDLLFYRQLDQDAVHHSPYHSMIVIGDAVVYHTGPMHDGKGEMRRLLITDLLQHPDARWRPLQENENFLGVYRWNILREGD